jgi:hypothetical protein
MSRLPTMLTRRESMLHRLFASIFPTPARRAASRPATSRRLSLEWLEGRSSPAQFVILSPGSLFAQIHDLSLTQSSSWIASAGFQSHEVVTQGSGKDTVEAGFQRGEGGNLTAFVHLGIPKPGTDATASVESRPSRTPGGAGELTYQLAPERGDRVGQHVTVDFRPTITGNTAGAHSSVHVTFEVFSGGKEVYHYDQTASGAAKHLPAAPECKFTTTIGATFQVRVAVSASGGGDAGDLHAQVALGPIYKTN